MVPILRAADNKACEYSFTTIFHVAEILRKPSGPLRGASVSQIRPRAGQHVYDAGGRRSAGRRVHPAGALPRGGYPLRCSVPRRRIPSGFPTGSPAGLPGAPSPGDADYIYNQADLALLAGKKYHGKRNHVAGFSKQYAWTYETIDDANAGEAADMATEWCKGKGNCADKGLKSENCAIREALRHRDELSLKGGLIRVDGKVIAFSLGSPISGTVFDVHVEKALPEYKGAYAVTTRNLQPGSWRHTLW